MEGRSEVGKGASFVVLRVLDDQHIAFPVAVGVEGTAYCVVFPFVMARLDDGKVGEKW